MVQHVHQQDATPLSSARRLLIQHRPAGWDAFADLFRLGSAPRSFLAGEYAGRFEAFSIAPGITQLVELIARSWMPWQGKTLNPQISTGYNILTNDSFGLVRLAAPSYCTFLPHRPMTYCAFPFRTEIAAGRRDPDRQVLRIDYDLPVNPGWSVRRLQDELVQIDDNVFLGKAYFKWWWGAWQLWAYFSLRPLSHDAVE